MSYPRVRLVALAPCGGPSELVMDAAELKRWLVSVARLTLTQKADLLRVLSARDDQAAVEDLVESRLG
ncbi:MAG: hypothetical protein QE285_16130, partial [Aquabacterium sp.]|nr:hypothetical protein [Aquabacterium sp.]